MHSIAFGFASASFVAASLLAAPLNDSGLQKYFENEVETISSQCLEGIDSRAEWEQERTKMRAQLFEMLSLDPLPERSDLRAAITGRIERDDFVVEKLHFQSSPGLYVTANFYLPKKIDKPLPTILYVCGHAVVKTNGISYGNKAGYQHHGAWFARNGYACLTIDTVQLGEIEGIHHGTHREGMWWWNSRGYTSAGVEAWNCIRALDYLETRPEVDKERFGVTGRSGGGAYSWWVAALDDRIKVAAPVAGITDLQDHVVDGVVEGHCDCMYFVNTYRWDYPAVAALVAPRPLLICNSDKDRIFPLDGVVRTHSKVAKIYDLCGASNNLGVLITEGPHKDTQDLQLPVFRWFNRHLKGEDPVIEMAATKLFTPQELKVFAKIPEDEITSRIHDTFVAKARIDTERPNRERLTELRDLLREKTFRGWPSKETPLKIERRSLGDGIWEYAFDSQEHIRLKVQVNIPDEARQMEVRVMTAGASEDSMRNFLQSGGENGARAVILVRGGADGVEENSRQGVQVRRRYMLVGQTIDGMRVWDILRGTQVLRGMWNRRVTTSAEDRQYANLMMASVFEPRLRPAEVLVEKGLSPQGPDYLNFLRFTSWDEIAQLTQAAARTGRRRN